MSPAAPLRLLACLLLTPVALSAQSPEAPTPPRVGGVVVDAQTLAVPNATVVLVNRGTGLERSTVTAADGRFAFASPGAGPFLVIVNAPGFAVAQRDLVQPDASLTVSLEPSRFEVRTTVQSASRQDELRDSTPAMVTVVEREQSLEPGSSSVAEALRMVPGIVTRRGSEGTNPVGEQVQGIDSRQVLVLLDGQPVSSARGIKSGLVNLDRYSLASVDRVEVVKGAASALYGSDAIGGVVNLITRDPRRGFEGAASIYGGTSDLVDAGAEIGTRQENWSLLVLGDHRQRDGFDLTPSTWDTTAADFDRNHLFAKGTWQKGSLVLTTTGDGYRNEQTSRVNGELGPQSSESTDAAWSLSERADWQIGSLTSAQARVYTSGYHEKATGSLAPPANMELPIGRLDERLFKADGTVSRVLGTRQFLQGGLEVRYDDYSGINRLRSEDGQSVTTGAGWVQDRIALGGRTTATLGLRVDEHSVFGTAVSPKAGVNVRLTDQVRLRAAYGHGFRAPDLGQLYYRFLNPSNFYQVIGNPSLEPERSKSLQGGVELSTTDGKARLGVSGYWNHVDNLIEATSLGFPTTADELRDLMTQYGIDSSFQPAPGRLLFLYENVAEARTRGIEADGQWRPFESLLVAGAYTYLQARDVERDLDLTGRYPHQGSVRVVWRPRNSLSLALQGIVFSESIATRSTVNGVPTNVMTPGFSLWDASVQQRIAGHVSITGAVLNLTDSEDPNVGKVSGTGAPLPIYRADYGRTFQAGVRVDFGGR